MKKPSGYKCELKDPNKINVFGLRIRKSRNTKSYIIAFGFSRCSGKTVEQAYYYDKSKWSIAEVKAHCKRHNGTFESSSVQNAIDNLIQAVRSI